MPKVTASKASKVPKRALADRTSNQNQDPAQQGNQPLSSTANKRKATRPIDQSDGEVDVSTKKRKSALTSAGSTAQTRASARTNKGQGGVIDQLLNVSNQILAPNRKLCHSLVIPDDVPANPMAPDTIAQSKDATSTSDGAIPSGLEGAPKSKKIDLSTMLASHKLVLKLPALSKRFPQAKREGMRAIEHEGYNGDDDDMVGLYGIDNHKDNSAGNANSDEDKGLSGDEDDGAETQKGNLDDKEGDTHDEEGNEPDMELEGRGNDSDEEHNDYGAEGDNHAEDGENGHTDGEDIYYGNGFADEFNRTQIEEPIVSHKEKSGGAKPPLSVLKDYRSRNRPVQYSVLDRHRTTGNHNVGNNDDGSDDGVDSRSKSRAPHSSKNDNGDILDDDVDNESKSRASRGSKGKLLGIRDPRNVKHYSRDWQNVLNDAKRGMRFYLLSEDAWPSRSDVLDMANTLLAEAIGKQGQIRKLDEAYEHTVDMNELVANEVYTFRGVVKEAARDAVKLHYSKYITPPATNFIGNQLQEYDIVSKQVESLLRHNRFTFHGKDKNGRTNNYMHPAIGMTCLTVFYRGNNPLALSFPEIFQRSIPPGAVALVVTALHLSISEFELGYHRTKDFTSEWEEIYRGYIVSVGDVLKHTYHGNKLRKALQGWAKAGWEHLQTKGKVVKTFKAHHTLD